MSFDDSPSLISPAMIAEAVNAVNFGPRPSGVPQFGLTDKGKVITLRGANKSLRDRVAKVTSSGWLHWYPAVESDRDLQSKKSVKQAASMFKEVDEPEVKHLWG